MSKAQTNRRATIERTTSETQVKVELVLDGTGRGQIQTTIPFLDHMLTLLAKHGFFDLTVQAKGDTDIDDHHTIEDIGIVIGDALKQALGSKEGIRRFGWASVPAMCMWRPPNACSMARWASTWLPVQASCW